jgi:biopolymer transport protein ExbD
MALFLMQPVIQETALSVKVGEFKPQSYWARRHTSAIKLKLSSSGYVHFIGPNVRFPYSKSVDIEKQIYDMLSEFPTDRAWIFVDDDVEVKYVIQLTNALKSVGVQRVALGGL